MTAGEPPCETGGDRRDGGGDGGRLQERAGLGYMRQTEGGAPGLSGTEWGVEWDVQLKIHTHTHTHTHTERHWQCCLFTLHVHV